MATTAQAQAQAAPNDQPQRAEIIWSYDLEFGAKLGNGASGAVYEAVWREQRVAVKIFGPTCETVFKQFMAELEIMSWLKHPNICGMLGACFQPTGLALVLEFVEQGSLWSVLRKKNLCKEVRVRMAMEVASAMAYLHSFEPPILHLDIKSLNVLVDADYHVKIADFGLARVKPHGQFMTGAVGTPQWMAPEVTEEAPYGEKADVYSFGILLWELFSGKCPYEGVAQPVAAKDAAKGKRPYISANTPGFVYQLMQVCWAQDPAKRPTFEEILQRCHKALHDLPMWADSAPEADASQDDSQRHQQLVGKANAGGKSQTKRRRLKKRHEMTANDLADMNAEQAQKQARRDKHEQNRAKHAQGIRDGRVKKSLMVAIAVAAGRPVPVFKQRYRSKRKMVQKDADRSTQVQVQGHSHGVDQNQHHRRTDARTQATVGQELPVGTRQVLLPASSASTEPEGPSWLFPRQLMTENA